MVGTSLRLVRRDQLFDPGQIALADLACGKKMGYEGRDISLEERIGDFGQHGAPDLGFRHHRDIDVLALPGFVPDDPSPLQSSQDGGNCLLGQAPLGTKGIGDLLNGRRPSTPQDPKDGKLEIGELMRFAFRFTHMGTAAGEVRLTTTGVILHL